MSKPYAPLDWYWLAQDGRVYGSARQAIVGQSDEAFTAWTEDGTEPTPWPKDEAGQESDAELKAVLSAYDLILPGADPDPQPVQTTFSFLEFMDLFTDAEQMTLVEASMTLPTVKLWYDKALGAEYIDIADPRMDLGLSALVAENLITADRKAKVMKGEKP